MESYINQCDVIYILGLSNGLRELYLNNLPKVFYPIGKQCLLEYQVQAINKHVDIENNNIKIALLIKGGAYNLSLYQRAIVDRLNIDCYDIKDNISNVKTVINYLLDIHAMHNLGRFVVLNGSSWITDDCNEINLADVQEYFNIRAMFTTERSFNNLSIQNNILTKTSSNVNKIMAEANWFNKAPSSIQKWLPKIKNVTDTSYSMEYMHKLPLSELLLFAPIVRDNIESIFNEIFKYINHSIIVNPSPVKQYQCNTAFKYLVRNKTDERIDDICKAIGVSETQTMMYNGIRLGTLNLIIETCINKTIQLPQIPSIMHGDLCFSNILVSQKMSNLEPVITVIDPRGSSENGQFSIYGDAKYDLAKLLQCFVGNYDEIVYGKFDTEAEFRASANCFNGKIKFDAMANDGNYPKNEVFNKIVNCYGVSVSDLMPLVTLLFLSMIPLHSDSPERQLGFFVNALRLYHNSKFQ